MAKLMAGAENCKHILSSRDTATCAIESLFEGIDMHSTVSRYCQCSVSVTVVIFIIIITQSVVFLSLCRARFESLCFSLFQQSLSTIDRVLATSNVTKDKVDQVIIYLANNVHHGGIDSF